MWPFKPKTPPLPRKLDVGRTIATVIENDGTTYIREFEGCYMGRWPWDHTQDWIKEGWDYFTTWKDECGKGGLVSVGKGKYVPLCNVKSITAKNFEHLVEVED